MVRPLPLLIVCLYLGLAIRLLLTRWPRCIGSTPTPLACTLTAATATFTVARYSRS